MSWIQTYTGKQFWPLNPRYCDVDIIDIAHALSNLCRFSGHVRSFYSVAQHSVLVSRLCPPRYALEGLLHDAAEAYCVDLPRPIKHSPDLAPYREIEARLEEVIAKRFAVLNPIPHAVKLADDALLMTERRDLMCAPPFPWKEEHQPPLELKIVPWSPSLAETHFLSRFYELRRV